MTSKERMVAAMTGKVVDRVPVMCQLALGHIYKNAGIPAVDYWYTAEGRAEGYIIMAERYSFDGILVNSWHGIDPELRKHVVLQKYNQDSVLVEFDDGKRFYCPPNDDPQILNPEMVVQKEISQIEPESVPILESAKDLPPWFGNVLDIVLARKGADMSVHGEIGTSFEDFLLTLGSFDAGLIALLDDPEKSKLFIARINQNCLCYAREQCSRGIDALKLSSPIAGAGFISRNMYEEFVLPYEKAVIEMVHAEFGIPCYIHTCGAIGDRLDLMLETGTDGLECLDPPPLGTVDLEQAVEQIGKEIWIKGNLDSVNELTNHSSREVKDIACKRIEIGKRAKGYILSSACSIAPDVPPENIEILYEAVMESE